MSLKELVAEEVKRPLSYEMLQTLLPRWCKFARYDSLAKFSSLKAALGGKSILVVLYNLHDRKGKVKNAPGHFICINARARNQPVEYFSSSGWQPAKEIAKTHSNPRVFQKLLGRNFIHNSVPFETEGDQQTCWRWVLMRCILGHVSLKEFQKLFAQKFIPNDSNDIAVLMTLLITTQKDLQ